MPDTLILRPSAAYRRHNPTRTINTFRSNMLRQHVAMLGSARGVCSSKPVKGSLHKSWRCDSPGPHTVFCYSICVIMSVFLRFSRVPGNWKRSHPKSKSSTPNLLYLISTLLYMCEASGFKLSSSRFDACSEICWTISAGEPSPVDICTSRAFSLKNLGVWMVLAARLADLVSSA